MLNTITLKDVANAIRKNGRPQYVGGDGYYGPSGSVCAIGMAAINLNVGTNVIDNILGGIKGTCPEHDQNWEYLHLDEVVIHLNDGHEWSFEQIADFLDKQENK